MAPGHFSTALVFAVLPFLILLLGLWWVDRYEKEPARLLVLALVFGAVVAPFVADAIEDLLDLTSSLSSQLIVPKFQLGIGTPLVEELVRGGAILIVFLIVRFEVDHVLDGIIYGGAVGVGFGAAANFVSILETPSLGDAHASLYKAIVSGLNHVFYGALIGLVLGLVRKRGLPVLALAAVGGAALAFGFHLLHDYLPWLHAASPSSVEGGFGRQLLTELPNYFGVFVIGAIAVWAAARERSIIQRELADEVSSGVVAQDDYSHLTGPFGRARILLLDFLWRGQRVWRLRRRLYAAEVELAFRKFHRGDREQTQSRAYGDEADYRAQIADLRRDLAKQIPDAAATGTERPRTTSALVAGVASALAYLALVGLFVLIWYLAFRPDTSENVPSLRGGSPVAAPSPAVPLASPPARTLAAASSQSKGGTIDVFACQNVRLRTCHGTVNDRGSIPRQLRKFIVVVQWRNLKPGSIVAVGFLNGETRQPVRNDRRFKVVRRTDYGLAYFEGPFPKMELVVAVAYNGALLDKLWRFEIV